MFYMGIDIGGTNLRAAVISDKGEIIETFKVKNETEKGAEYNLNKIADVLKNKWSKYNISKAGVGCPGPLDLKKGMILNPPNLKDWGSFNIKDYLTEKLGIPVKVNNDANVAGYAEAVAGCAKDAESVFYITISTGVGGGLIIDKKIINGAHSQCAEIYNMIINEDDYVQPGLNKSSLEGQCSGVNIARIASSVKKAELTTKEVFDLYEDKDEEIVHVIDKWVDNIAVGIADIIAVVDPEVIVLGGAVPINNPYLIDKITESVKKKTADPGMVEIRLAELGDNAGLIGAAML